MRKFIVRWHHNDEKNVAYYVAELIGESGEVIATGNPCDDSRLAFPNLAILHRELVMAALERQCPVENQTFLEI